MRRKQYHTVTCRTAQYNGNSNYRNYIIVRYRRAREAHVCIILCVFIESIPMGMG